MANGDTNLAAECVENDLARHEEEDSKRNVSKRPSVAESPGDKQNLHDQVDEQLDRVEDVENDKETDRVRGSQARPALERRQRNEETNGKGNERANTHHPHRERRAILIQLKSHEAVDEQTCHQRTRQPILHAHKVRIRLTARRGDAGVDDERDEAEQHVQVEEAEDLLAADGGELAADVQDHDDGHDDGDDVHGRGGALEDDGVGQLDVARVAVRLDAHAVVVVDGPDGGAEGEGRLVAEGGEVAEARHDGREIRLSWR